MPDVFAVAAGQRGRIRAISTVCAASLAVAIFSCEAAPAAAAAGYAPANGGRYDAPVRRKARGRRAKAAEPKLVENTSVERPLFAIVSLGGQHISIYNHHGLVERSTISTGVPGHPTPEGVFSILGRERFHRSNLYSGAPMPFMQRVTWSGIAMHQGVVTGRPASHGCIRLPAAFAAKLWGLTRVGERVVIAPGDLSPAEVASPALPAPKLRAPIEASAAPAAATLVNPRHYADQLAAKAQAEAATAARSATEASQSLAAKRKEAGRAAAELRAAQGAEAVARAKAAAAAKAVDFESRQRQEAVRREAARLEIAHQEAALQSPPDSARPEPAASEPSPAEAAKAKAEAAFAEATTRVETAKAAVAANGAAIAAATRRAKEAAEAAKEAAKTEKDARLRTSPISILVSKRDKRIYVRQGFTPIFDAPITVREPERPLGSHLFIATAAGEDGASLKWTALSGPASRTLEARADRKRGKKGGLIEARSAASGPASSAAEALERIEIPETVRERIAERLWLGGSLIVSDQGPSSETSAAGTDLTVKFR